MKKCLIILGVFTLQCSFTQAQDIHFSQYRETPLLINPAQTALNKDIRIVLNYKDQWRSFVSPYKTFAFSGETKINSKQNKNNYIGLGLQFYSDKAGDSKMRSTTGSINISGIITLNEKSKLGLGIMGGFGQRTIDYSSLQWESQYVGMAYNPNAPSGEQEGANSYTYPDVGAGIAWNLGKDQMYISANNGVHATLGISVFHFGLPQYSYYNQTSEKLNTKFIGHGNIEFGIQNTSLLIAPELFFVKQGTQQEIIVGSVFKYVLQEGSKYTGNKKSSAVSLGAVYRIGDAFVPSLMYEYSNYAIGISYDVNLSKLRTVSTLRGGFEISLRFVTPNPFGAKSRASF